MLSQITAIKLFTEKSALPTGCLDCLIWSVKCREGQCISKYIRFPEVLLFRGQIILVSTRNTLVFLNVQKLRD